MTNYNKKDKYCNVLYSSQNQINYATNTYVDNITVLGIIVEGPASQRAQGVVNSSRGEEDSKPELLNYGGRTRVIVLCWCVNKRKSQKAGKRRRHSEKWGKIL